MAALVPHISLDPSTQGLATAIMALETKVAGTPGTAVASAPLVPDASNNLSGLNNLTLTGLFTESAADALTAAGTTQGTALALTKELNRFTTVGALSGATLPAAAPGLTIIVINSGANPLQVYGAGTDTIDDVATATGVSQMVGSVAIYACTVAGKWYSEGLGTGWAGSLQTVSFAGGLTAFAGGGQASALQLAATINRVSTVATLADSVKLPASAAGLMITVINASAKDMQVFGAGTDTINGVATATGILQPANSIAVYVCTAAGVWECEGVGQGFSGQYPTVTARDALTAFAGGGQGSALLLPAIINRVTTVASAADSVKLPVSKPGMQITVINAAAANSMNVFPQTGESINALAANTAFAVVANKTVNFYCAVAGTWHAVLSA